MKVRETVNFSEEERKKEREKEKGYGPELNIVVRGYGWVVA